MCTERFIKQCAFEPQHFLTLILIEKLNVYLNTSGCAEDLLLHIMYDTMLLRLRNMRNMFCPGRFAWRSCVTALCFDWPPEENRLRFLLWMWGAAADATALCVNRDGDD